MALFGISNAGHFSITIPRPRDRLCAGSERVSGGPRFRADGIFLCHRREEGSESARCSAALSMKRTSRMNDSCFLSPVMALVRALSLLSCSDPRCESRQLEGRGNRPAITIKARAAGVGRGRGSGEAAISQRTEKKMKAEGTPINSPGQRQIGV